MSDKQTVFMKKGKKPAEGKSSPLSAKGLIRKNVSKRWLLTIGAAVGVVIVVAVAAAPEKSGPRKREAPTTRISVTPPQADKVNFEAQYAKSLDVLQEGMKSMQRTNETLVNNMSTLQSKLEDMEKKQSADAMARAKAAAKGDNGLVVSPPTLGGGGLSIIGGTGGPPAPPTPVNGGQSNPNVFTPPVIGGTMLPPTIPGQPVGSMTSPAPAPRAAAPVVYEAPEVSKAPEAPDAQAEAAKAAGRKASLQRNRSAGMLPAGPFAPVALLHGLEAGTSSSTQSNPMPVLLNIQENAVMPGNANYKLKNCFVLGNGYGDLSSERVYIRLNRLSCVDKANRMVLSQEVQGYLVDSDGKLGLRGVVYNRQGAALGKSMLAGFAQGLASALGSAQSTVSSSLTTGLSSSTINGGAALRASGLQGAQQATAQLADFYLKEAQNIFPGIAIDAGRTGTMVFTNSVTLEWASAEDRYVADDKPQ